MLAATQFDERYLDTIKLVLSLISKNQTNVPDALKKQFELILRQARALVAKPGSRNESWLPESIEFALELRAMESLSKELERVNTYDEVSPDLAARLLRKIKEDRVCS